MPNPSSTTPLNRLHLSNRNNLSSMVTTPYPKSKQLHYHEAVQRYFARLEAEGHDLREFRHFLRQPGGIPPRAMIRFAEHVGANLGELIANGIGRNNSIDDLDRAARQHYGDKAIGLTDIID